ncbi:MAG TPA: ribosome small subunit-dependent GTPase A [Planctomycetota bacterium]|nr:ribosome small subunit-dependent GTPase A [Planctomycetota bacterium]
MSGPRRGVVIRDEGSCVIVDLDGEEARCIVRKGFVHRARNPAKAVAVGDRVRVEASGEGLAVVAVDPRRSAISRPDPSRPRREQILVANIDAVLVVAAARDPDLVPALVDRFLVDAESRGLVAGIALTKIDLAPEASSGEMATLYKGLGYDVLAVSSVTGEGLEAVRDFLRDRTTALLGHSGVGKSSLANALDPSLRLRVGPVQEGTGLGTHTTTTVSLLRLPWGGYLVDTPGIREFGLWAMDPRELRHAYREMAVLAGGCRFTDCLHEREPGCAVKKAAAAGAIAPCRYESYLRLLASLREARES